MWGEGMSHMELSWTLFLQLPDSLINFNAWIYLFSITFFSLEESWAVYKEGGWNNKIIKIKTMKHLKAYFKNQKKIYNNLGSDCLHKKTNLQLFLERKQCRGQLNVPWKGFTFCTKAERTKQWTEQILLARNVNTATVVTHRFS